MSNNFVLTEITLSFSISHGLSLPTTHLILFINHFSISSPQTYSRHKHTYSPFLPITTLIAFFLLLTSDFFQFSSHIETKTCFIINYSCPHLIAPIFLAFSFQANLLTLTFIFRLCMHIIIDFLPLKNVCLFDHSFSSPIPITIILDRIIFSFFHFLRESPPSSIALCNAPYISSLTHYLLTVLTDFLSLESQYQMMVLACDNFLSHRPSKFPSGTSLAFNPISPVKNHCNQNLLEEYFK